MGTIISTIACSKMQVDYLVGDSYVCDPVLLQDRFLKSDNFKVTLPDDRSAYRDMLAKLKTNMLIFTGTTDKFTTVADSKVW